MKRIIKHNENWTVDIKFAQIWRRGAERESLCKWSIGSRARKWFERPSAHHTTAGITQLEFRGVARTIAGRARLCGTHRTHCCWPMGYCWSSVYSVKLDGALTTVSEPIIQFDFETAVDWSPCSPPTSRPQQQQYHRWLTGCSVDLPRLTMTVKPTSVDNTSPSHYCLDSPATCPSVLYVTDTYLGILTYWWPSAFRHSSEWTRLKR